MFRKKLSRGRLLAFFAAQPPCVVALEACAGSRHWGRELARLVHIVRLIPPAYVKPFVKRQKNDAADAEAICEAAQRPTMRFVPVKSEAQQASGVVFRARDLLVRQRTQILNAIRGHLAEYGRVAPKGICYVERLVAEIEDPTSELPEAARASLVALLPRLDGEIARLDREIARRAKEDATARRLMTIPGVGPITAAALVALAPPPEAFRRGRDFSAWLGLTPLQRSSGGKQKLGEVSKMGERTLRRLLVIGASAVIKQALLRGAPPGSWLAQMLTRKPRMLVAVALANKMGRMTPRKPWNAGRLVGPKAPLKPKHVWAIRQQLKTTKRTRDLALFNCALDAKLRACDLVKLRVSDVAPGGALLQRSTVIQQKTGRPVPFELTEPTREALVAWLALRGRRSDDWLFPSRSRAGEHIGTRQYARLVDRWVRIIDLQPDVYGTHSLRRAKVALVYKKTGNLRACQLLLGHRKLESTVRYLGMEVDDALAISEQIEL